MQSVAGVAGASQMFPVIIFGKIHLTYIRSATFVAVVVAKIGIFKMEGILF